LWTPSPPISHQSLNLSLYINPTFSKISFHFPPLSPSGLPLNKLEKAHPPISTFDVIFQTHSHSITIFCISIEKTRIRFHCFFFWSQISVWWNLREMSKAGALDLASGLGGKIDKSDVLSSVEKYSSFS